MSISSLLLAFLAPVVRAAPGRKLTSRIAELEGENAALREQLRYVERRSQQYRRQLVEREALTPVQPLTAREAYDERLRAIRALMMPPPLPSQAMRDLMQAQMMEAFCTCTPSRSAMLRPRSDRRSPYERSRP